MAGERRGRGVDICDLQGAGVRHIPLIHQGRLGLPHALAQAPHPRPGVIGLPTRVGQPVRPVPRQVRVAHQHHLRAIGEPGVERLQDAPGLGPHARHGHALLDRRALQAPVGGLNRLPAARCAAGPGNEAPPHNICDAHIGAADCEHHQIGVGRHPADLLVHDVLGRGTAAGKTRKRCVHPLLTEPVHIVVHPAVAAAIGLAARVVRLLDLVVAGTASGRVRVPEKGDSQRHIALRGVRRRTRRSGKRRRDQKSRNNHKNNKRAGKEAEPFFRIHQGSF